jgi:transcriptional regulator GlxA family with amidase domain
MSTSVTSFKPVYPIDIRTAADSRGWRLDSRPRQTDRSGPIGGNRLTEWQIKCVLAFIEDHFEEAITVTQLSKVARLSAAYFTYKFKNSLGSTPHVYLIQRRLDRARHLMLTSNAKLSQIALTCGFIDQAHLCKMFRQTTGQTPAAWRREHHKFVEAGWFRDVSVDI